MTPPISLRALLEAEAKATASVTPLVEGRDASLSTLAGLMKHAGYADGDSGYFYREFTYEEWTRIRIACDSFRPLAESLQEAIAALEEVRDADPMPYRPTHVTADVALAKIREKVVE